MKKIGIVFEGDSPKPGQIETLSEAYPPKVYVTLCCYYLIPTCSTQPSVTYTVPEPSCEGPVLEAGPDYSKDRKTDYPTETSDE